MVVSHHGSPDSPVRWDAAESGWVGPPPVRPGLVRTVVADGSITVFVTGGLVDRPAVKGLCAELGFATSVCRGIVTVDLTGCPELGPGAAQVLQGHQYAARISRARCRFRIVAGERSMVRALTEWGVSLDQEDPRPGLARRSGAGRMPVDLD